MIVHIDGKTTISCDGCYRRPKPPEGPWSVIEVPLPGAQDDQTPVGVVDRKQVSAYGRALVHHCPDCRAAQPAEEATAS